MDVSLVNRTIKRIHLVEAFTADWVDWCNFI